MGPTVIFGAEISEPSEFAAILALDEAANDAFSLDWLLFFTEPLRLMVVESMLLPELDCRFIMLRKSLYCATVIAFNAEISHRRALRPFR